MPGFFITGASGFVGRALLSRLKNQECDVIALTRDPDALARAVPPLKGWRYLSGDLTNPSSYQDALRNDLTVIHLAAVTGKTREREYFRVIDEGTRSLLSSSISNGVRRFVFVSSIAAGFPDQRFYPYAQAKAQAEAAVRESSLDWVIVRPTMVFGPKSPVLKGLTTLACGPAVLLPGAGEVLVQPVDRDDLARVLVTLAEDSTARDIIEVGGPDRVTMRALLLAIRDASRDHQGGSGTVVRLPLGLMRHTLAFLEPALLPVLPLTAGQLASFANASTASPSPRLESLLPFRSLKDMLDDLRT